VGGKYYGIEVQPAYVAMVRKLFKEQNLEEYAEVLCGKAPEVVTGMFSQTSVDLFFIDDNHTGTHVEREIEAFWPLLKPNGLMAFHDVVGDFPVWDLIKDLGGVKLVYRPFNRLGQAPFGGLGLVQKPG
jgi:predicted O-methyltransferase YrrM